VSETAARARARPSSERASARERGGRGWAEREWVWVVGIILLVSVWFFPLTFQGKVFSSPDAQAPQGFGVYAEAERARTGEYPLWNPFIFSGIPSYAALAYNPDVYFPDWILKPLGRHAPPMLWLILYYMVGAVGLFLFLRDRGAARPPAALAGLLFALTPNLIAVGAHGHGSQLVNSGWIPVALLALHRWLARGRVVWLALLALVLGAQILRGHMQIVYYTWLALGLYLVFYVLEVRGRRSLFTMPIGRALAGVAVALVLAACLGAVLALPVLAYSPHSIRGGGPAGGVGFEYATGWSLGWAEILTFVVPSALGFGGETYWGTMPFTDYPHYLGILTVLFAVVALLPAGRAGAAPKRGASPPAEPAVAPLHPGYFVALAVVGVVIALGKHSPIYNLLYNFMPGFNKFRVPVMILVLTQLAAAALFALGLTRVLALAGAARRSAAAQALASRFRAAVIAVVVMLLFAAVAGGPIVSAYTRAFRASPRIAQQLAAAPEQAQALGTRAARRFHGDLLRGLAFLAGGSALAWLALRGRVRGEVLAGGVAVLSVIDLGPIDYAIMSPLIFDRSVLATPAEPDPAVQFLLAEPGRFRVLPVEEFTTNRYATWGIASAGGYHAAKPIAYQQFMQATGLDDLSLFRYPERYRILDLLNVRYLLTRLQVPESERFRIVFPGPPVAVIENRLAGPRAFVVGQVQVEANPERALALLLNPAFDLIGTAVVDTDPGQLGGAGVTGKAEVTEFELNRVGIDVESTGDALVVIGDLYAPGWSATVDGAPAPVVRADTIFRGVRVPGGKHRVELRYMTPGLRPGLYLSAGALAVLALVGIGSLGWERVRRRGGNAKG
jgi:hypothetical protein